MRLFRLLIGFIIFMPTLQATENASRYTTLITKVNSLMHKYHYMPEQLNGAGYQNMLVQMQAHAKTASSDEAFIEGFNKLWHKGPFSHVRMQANEQPADALAAYLDQMQVGENATSLTIDDSIALMQINTMMGTDTIERIGTYYKQIISANVSTLIIDLRNNNGGAFAVKPLLGHLIEAPLDVGMFVSQPWNAKHNKPPSIIDAQKRQPWFGWSIRSFWQDVQTVDLLRIQMQPHAPYFTGKVYVLTSKQTASAAELGTDALGYLDNVKIIGETTAGEMLSQSVFDLAEGILLFLPIADYYSHRSGRIEGQGVKPDIEIAADQALIKAKELISGD